MEITSALTLLLRPVSWIYGLIVRARGWLYDHGWLKAKRLNATVISVGNITVGGTGKTPMVIWLAENFLKEGKRVAILSRGYRGKRGTSDEIELMKHRLQGKVQFGVGKNRFAEGRKLEKQGVDIFLLDDGFQHRQLARDVDILMLDGSRKFKGLLPAGRLREPVSACERADLIVVTRKTERPDIVARFSHRFSIFYAQTRLLGFRRFGENDSSLRYASEIGFGPFLAFCGIGHPQAFLDDLSRWHVPVAGHRFFRDHHRYSEGDARTLSKAAEKAGATALVTTEKDAENLGVEFRSMKVYVAAIDFVLNSDSEFLAALERTLANKRGVATQA